VHLNPNLAEAHANLGAAFAKISGRLPDAKMELRRALELRPEMQRVQQMLNQIDSAQSGSGS
jgi:Flp pilus assembly protein TadD